MLVALNVFDSLSVFYTSQCVFDSLKNILFENWMFCNETESQENHLVLVINMAPEKVLTSQPFIMTIATLIIITLSDSL